MIVRIQRALAAATLAGALACTAGCGDGAAANGGESLARASSDAWTGAALADFELTERSGRTVTLGDLAGKPFVMDFVFTTCAGPCGTLSTNLRWVQDELAGDDVRLVSVTVDPRIDDPETLARYADELGADPERWLFLTGDEAAIGELMASVHLAMVRAPDGEAEPGFQVTHSTKFVVVDGEGVVRGYYDGQDPAGRRAAAKRARWLAGRGE